MRQPRDVDRGVVAGEANERGAHALQARQHAAQQEEADGGLKAGDMVRVIRQPFFGRIGRVTALPPELMPLETEARVRVLEVDFGSDSRALLPRANVEMIES